MPGGGRLRGVGLRFQCTVVDCKDTLRVGFMADPEGNEFCILRALRPDET